MLYFFLCNVIKMNMQLERFKTDIIPLRKTLFAIALKWMQQEEDAEDATQETLLRLWNIREQLDAVANPKAFAVQTVKNICIDYLRAQKEKAPVDEILTGVDHETPYSGIERKDAVALVKRIIERLPVLQQTIIRMRDIEGYELQEIAEITGTQISAVTTNLSRARKKVRDQYMKMMNYRL
ncbi:MAG: sigma-70 family RNA polymerase sigma factor [Tannerella sp.]|nr:sigma-70 family RNA polymerase sigma factor [Tannerella sp.]